MIKTAGGGFWTFRFFNQAKGMSTSRGLKIWPINWFSVGWGPYNGDDLLPKIHRTWKMSLSDKESWKGILDPIQFFNNRVVCLIH